MTTEPDKLMLKIAENAWRAGAPREIWARLVCEAHGVDASCLPRTESQLRIAQEFDLAETRATLDEWSNR